MLSSTPSKVPAASSDPIWRRSTQTLLCRSSLVPEYQRHHGQERSCLQTNWLHRQCSSKRTLPLKEDGQLHQRPMDCRTTGVFEHEGTRFSNTQQHSYQNHCTVPSLILPLFLSAVWRTDQSIVHSNWKGLLQREWAWSTPYRRIFFGNTRYRRWQFPQRWNVCCPKYCFCEPEWFIATAKALSIQVGKGCFTTAVSVFLFGMVWWNSSLSRRRDRIDPVGWQWIVLQ